MMEYETRIKPLKTHSLLPKNILSFNCEDIDVTVLTIISDLHYDKLNKKHTMCVHTIILLSYSHSAKYH